MSTPMWALEPTWYLQGIDWQMPHTKLEDMVSLWDMAGEQVQGMLNGNTTGMTARIEAGNLI